MKIKNLFFASLFVIGAVSLTSCQKTPSASFTTDKTTYSAGDVVHLTNTTIDGASYLWTFPNGTTGTATNYNYTLNVNDADGIATFKLKAYSKNGKKSDEASGNIIVNHATGSVVFWYNSSGSNATVSINGQVGTINGSYYYSSAPSCGASYCATFTLPIGTYNYTASSSFQSWSGTVTITYNGCTSVLLL